jgi:hypothetical protein
MPSATREERLRVAIRLAVWDVKHRSLQETENGTRDIEFEFLLLPKSSQDTYLTSILYSKPHVVCWQYCETPVCASPRTASSS